ncbi:MAG: S9 family peptidase, partial [Flammeovirgaceae bacterium]|nr:S9 family peptidase [Flammeovirgaceae bacterium]
MKRSYAIFLLKSIVLFLFSSCQEKQETMLSYPTTKKVEVEDVYFGEKVSDPYRWLENDTAAETTAWVDAQNKVTFDYLAKIPFRQKIKNRLEEIFNYPRYSQPFKVGEYFLFYKNDGLQNQAVIYIQKGLDGEPEVFLDPNQLSPDGTVTAN